MVNVYILALNTCNSHMAFSVNFDLALLWRRRGKKGKQMARRGKAMGKRSVGARDRVRSRELAACASEWRREH